MDKRIEKIMEKFDSFTNGYRFIMLCHRNKEGGVNRDRKQIKKVSKNKEHFIDILSKMFEVIDRKKEIPYRIYSCVNARDIDKAIRNFKFLQLEADYYDTESRNSLYLDIKNRWFSALMRPNARTETNFLIDIDEDDDYEKIKSDLCKITRNQFEYKTKNGYHIITTPFNPALLKAKINKDGLLLLYYPGSLIG